MLIDDLLVYLFDGQSHPLARPVAAWLTSSRRFTSFVHANHTKIRKKLRTTQETESLRDLQLELETAHLLLREQSLSLVYEPQHRSLGRSPDFEVSFTTSLTFMVEVTRMRAIQSQVPELALTGSLLDERFSDVLVSKLGQLLPKRGNVLIIGVEASTPTYGDLQAVMLRIQQRAERNDASLVPRHGFRDRSEFFQHYQRLSELLVRSVPLQAGEPAVMWANPQAKVPLPAKVRTAFLRSHTL